MDNSPPSPWITWSWSREGNCHLSWMCLTTSPVVRQLWSMPLSWCQVLDPLGRHPIYRLHPEKQRAVNTEIASLLEQGIIEETNSPWAAPILVVPKPDGTGRLCVDY